MRPLGDEMIILPDLMPIILYCFLQTVHKPLIFPRGNIYLNTTQEKPSLSSSRKFIKDLQLEQAHKASSRNREQIERSKQCGCFSCCRIFPASEVTDYVSREEPTALCPYCYTDSVLGDASGYPITKEFLKEMNKRWF